MFWFVCDVYYLCFMKKKCNKCKKHKGLSEYYTDNRAKDKRNGSCKICMKKERKGLSTEYSRRIVKTKEGLLKRIYHTQCRTSRKRKHPKPKYCKDDFINKSMYNLSFCLVFTEWEESGFDRWLIPSADRIDESLGYSFDNIKWVTWKENDNRQKRSERQKEIIRKITESHIIPIQQIDLEGNIVKEWIKGTKEIKEFYKSINNIRAVCRGERNQAYGYKWRYTK